MCSGCITTIQEKGKRIAGLLNPGRQGASLQGATCDGPRGSSGPEGAGCGHTRGCGHVCLPAFTHLDLGVCTDPPLSLSRASFKYPKGFPEELHEDTKF